MVTKTVRPARRYRSERLQEEVARVAQAQQGKTVAFVTHDIDEAVSLSDRVVVMVGGPGRIQGVIPVPLPRPRSRTSGDFLSIRAEVYGALEDAQILAAA